jgi:hypothetical protein
MERSNSKATIDVNSPIIEEDEEEVDDDNDEKELDDEQETPRLIDRCLTQLSVSSGRSQCVNDPRILSISLSSSSSDLDLSNLIESSDDMNSVAICTDTDDDTSLSLTPMQSASDQESVLYFYLSDELHMNMATFDSDLERIDR